MSADCSKKKILIELMHGIGDTVCSLPMLQVLRDNYPDAQIVVLTKTDAGRNIILLSQIPIDKIYIFDIYKDMFHSLKFLLQLRQVGFTYGISSCVTPVRKAKYFMKIVNPKKWIGLQKQGLFFDLLNNKYHFVEANLLAIKDICKIPEEKLHPKLYPEKQCLDRMKKQINLTVANSGKKIIGVCIGNADYTLKNKFLRYGYVYTRAWGIENITKLINLLDQAHYRVLLFGGNREKMLLNHIKKNISMSDRIIDFVGKTNIQESTALAKLCDCVVGVDTGMQHVAAAVGTQTVSIFGPTNPKTHGAYSNNSIFVETNQNCKYCYGTVRYINCKNRVCLDSIDVNTVLEFINNAV
jgi:ADP-heptose:LPS heptosyltransferase